ncbi:MAG: MATE family efflux transporter, partial [Acetatifactor sp.]|nr:MATE family efflux transporter [Acetatifactor sp.]
MTQKDLTKGPVFSTLCFFALPMILGNVLQQGYNIVDTWVVGHYAGSDALAAVGAAFALMTFLTSVL